jgi:hypothetical protein
MSNRKRRAQLKLGARTYEDYQQGQSSVVRDLCSFFDELPLPGYHQQDVALIALGIVVQDQKSK